MELKGRVESSTVTVGDFKIPLSIMNSNCYNQTENKETEELTH